MNKTQELLIWAQNNHRSICAFNFSTIDVALAILKEAKISNAPVILETSPREAEFVTPKEAHSLVSVFRSEYNFALHLDHGNTQQLIQECVKAGYDSVHIDLKENTLDDLMEKTRLLTIYCHSHQIAVESGFDTIANSLNGEKGPKSVLTDPEKAVLFVTKTGIDFLVVSIGETHGIASQEKLDLALLSEIHRRISVPLVLHGGSGLSKGDLQNAIRLGVCKVNFNTELRLAWIRGIRQVFEENPSEIVPYKILPKAHDLIKDVVRKKIKICTTSSL